MKRRLNYTERKRITQDRITISVTRRKGLAESFSASVKLDGLNLPDAAKVYIEAYHRTDYARYVFGTVGNPILPEYTGLSDLARPSDLRFRILVVDEAVEHGLILASADRIRPTVEYEKRSILPVVIEDLGRQVWKLDFTGDEPVLVLNERLPNIHNLPSTDPRFRLYILPAILREVFSHMFFVERIEDLEEPAVDWHRNWLDFAKKILPHEADWPQRSGDEYSSEDVTNWINLLEREFCISLGKDWLKLVSLEEVG